MAGSTSRCGRVLCSVLLLLLMFICCCTTPSPASATTVCPNACSQHGTCGVESTCTCNTGWKGPDCSQRTCPTFRAWFAKATGTDTIPSVECAGVGNCNYDTGECDCMPGFEGNACQRTTCPNSCQYRGRCSTMSAIANEEGADGTNLIGGDGEGPAYTLWDSARSYGCQCDWGWAGGDCSLEMCPKGDDPKTLRQNKRAIKLTLDNSDGSEALDGTYTIRFNGHETSDLSADGDTTTASVMKSALEALDPILSVYVDQSTPDATDKGSTYTIVLTFAPHGQNNFHTFDGSVAIGAFTCNIANVSSTISGTPSCQFTDVDLGVTVGGSADGDSTFKVKIVDGEASPNTFAWSKDFGDWSTAINIPTGAYTLSPDSVTVTFASTVGYTTHARWTITATSSSAALTTTPSTTEHEYCSGRGVCLFSSGTCSCASETDGQGCEQLPSLEVALDNPPTNNAKHLYTPKADYTGNILQLTFNQWESTAFSAIRFTLNDKPTFYVGGDGKIYAPEAELEPSIDAGTLVVQSNFSIAGGPLLVTAGSVTVGSGDLLLPQALTLTSTCANKPILDGTASAAGYINSVVRVTTTKAASNTFNMLQAIANGVEVLDVKANGLVTIANGLHVTSASEATVTTGGLRLITGDTTVSTTGLIVTTPTAGERATDLHASSASFVGTAAIARVDQGIGSGANLLQLSSSTTSLFRVRGDGYTVIPEQGLEVFADGATVNAGGLAVISQLQVTAGGVTVGTTAGATISAGGLAVDDGATTFDSDLVYTTILQATATSGSFGDAAVLVQATGTVTPSAFNLLNVQHGGGYDVLKVNGRGDTTVTNSTILGDSAADTLTLSSTIQGTTMSFQGKFVDDYLLDWSFDTLTTDRNYKFTDTAVGTTVALTSGLTNNRIAIIDNTFGVVTTSSDLTFTGSVLNLNGPSAAMLRSTTAGVSLTGQTTTLVRGIAGDITLSSTDNGIAFVASHATNGDVSVTAGDTMAVSAGAMKSITLSTKTGTSSGALALSTGDGSTVGSITMATGSSSTETGSITLSSGTSTGNDGGDLSITSGPTAVNGATAGNVVINAGDGWSSGGSISIVANDATTTGGSITLKARGSGSVTIKDGDGGAALFADDSTTDVTAAGAVTMQAATSLSLSAQASTAVLNAALSITIASTGDELLMGADSITATTENVGGRTPGGFALTAGGTTASSQGADVALSAGKSSSNSDTGGDISLTAGAGEVKGGSVTVTGGGGKATGGNVIVTPGASGGSVIIRDSAGTPNDVFTVDAAVAIDSPASATMNSATALTVESTAASVGLTAATSVTMTVGTTATLESYTAFSVTSGAAAPVTLSAGASIHNTGAAVTIEAGDTGGNSATGGALSVTAGDGSGPGGDIVLTAGASTGGVDGDIVLHKSDGAAPIPLSVTSAGGIVAAPSSVSFVSNDANPSGSFTFASGAASAGESGGITIATGGADSGLSGSVAFTAGRTNQDPGASVSVTAGEATAASKTGGPVVLTGGESSLATGGAVSIDGGGATVLAGNVVMTGGTGSTTDGVVKLRAAQESSYNLQVASDGAVSIAALTTGLVSGSVSTTLQSSASTATLAASGGTVTLSAVATTITVTGDTGVTVGTNDIAAGTAQPVSLTVGQTDAANDGGNLVVTAGETSGNADTGGHVLVTGGTGSDVGFIGGGNGGAVSIAGGAGTTTGGDVVLVPGNAATDGSVVIKDGAANSVIVVDESRAVDITSPADVHLSAVDASLLRSTSSSLSTTAATGMTLSATAGSLTAASLSTFTLRTSTSATSSAGAITLSVGATETAADGGDLVITGGATTGTSTRSAGDVSVTAGAATGTSSTGGDVVLTARTGLSANGDVILEESGNTDVVKLTGAGAVETTTANNAAATVATDGKSSGTTGVVLVGSGASSDDASGALTFASGTGTTTAGALSVVCGVSQTSDGAPVVLTAGTSSQSGGTGGAVQITGGAAPHVSGGTGGTVSLVGGAGTTTLGGSVVLQAGDGATDGTVGLWVPLDGDANDPHIRVLSDAGISVLAETSLTVTTAGALTMSSSGGSGTWATAGASTVRSTTSTVTLTGDTGTTIKSALETGSSAGALTVVPGDTTTSATGGRVLVTGGKATSSGETGGSVSIIAGAATHATSTTGGNVVLTPGDGVTDGGVQFYSAATSSNVMYTDSSANFFVEAASATVSSSAGTSTGDATVTTGDVGGAATVGTMHMTTGAATGGVSAGAISVQPGSPGLGAAGAPVQIIGGASTKSTAGGHGGDVTVTGGLATTGAGSTGGSVVLLGGTPDETGEEHSTTGGSVTVEAGDGSSANGVTYLKDGSPANRVELQADGDVVVTAVSFVVESAGAVSTSAGTTTTLQAAAAVTVSSTADAVVFTGDTVTTITTSTAGGAAVVALAPGDTEVDGAVLSMTGGASSGASRTGGHAVLTGGAGTATGGHVSIVGGSGGASYGNVVARPGGGATAGTIALQNDAGTARLTVGATGNVDGTTDHIVCSGVVTLSATTAGVGSLALQASTQVTLSASGGTLEIGADHNDGVIIVTSDKAGDTSDVVLAVGNTNFNDHGGVMHVTGGKTTGDLSIGGDVLVHGGSSAGGTTSTAGDVVITGGAGSSDGGSVILAAGAGTDTHGEAALASSEGDNRVRVRAGGDVLIDSSLTITELFEAQGRVVGSVDVVEAGEFVSVSLNHTIMYITDDGTDWGANTNTITFDAYTPVDAGQFFVVINRDAQPTQGTFVVASNDMEAFVYDGSSWYKFNNN